ncbi:hypothetical protein BJY52DRAFT_1186920 [Lactarius psammicola]|nr:hypothetical protein BJY52DRAFT_1186920 [Lactarius psammicola]
MNTVWPASEHTSLNMNRFEKRARGSTKAPNNGGISIMGSGQEAERNNEALIIRSLEQLEKGVKAVIISASAIGASLIWCIIHGIQNLQAARTAQKARHYLDLYATSPRVAVPPIPHALDSALAPSGFGLLWANAYWITSLVFGLSAISIAVLVKSKIQEHKIVLQCRGQSLEKALVQESLDGGAEAWYMSEATDTMYRLLQVTFVVFLLGHVNSFLYPLGATIFIPTVIWCLLYVFGAIGLTVSSEQPPQSPSPG